MIVAMAIEDVNMMFRKDRRMEEREIALTAKRIVNQYWYLKPEDIKKCFNSRRPKQFVLEGDSFMSWIADYDLQRDNACEDDAANRKSIEAKEAATTYTDYLARLERRAADGEESAKRQLADIDYIKTKTQKALSEDERKENEIKFRLFRHRYEQSSKRHIEDDTRGKEEGV